MNIVLFFQFLLTTTYDSTNNFNDNLNRDRQIKVVQLSDENGEFGLNTQTRLFLRKRKTYLTEEKIYNFRHERIKKRHTKHGLYSEERSSEIENEEGVVIFNNASSTEIDTLGPMKNKIFEYLIKNITKSISQKHFLEFAIDPRFSQVDNYFMFIFKQNQVDLVNRIIINGVVKDVKIKTVLDSVTSGELLDLNKTGSLKCKEAITKIFEICIDENLLPIQENSTYAFIFIENNSASSSLSDIFLYPNAVHLKKYFSAVMDKLNIQYKSLTFINKKYYEIINETIREEIHKRRSSNGKRIDEENALSSCLLVSKVESYSSFDYRKNKDSNLNPVVLFETEPIFTIKSTNSEERLDSTNLELIFDTKFDSFRLFSVLKRNGHGKIFHVDLNKKQFQKLIAYKTKQILNIDGELNNPTSIFVENCNILSDFSISSFKNNEEINNDDKLRIFVYNLIFTNRNAYQNAIKQLLLDHKQNNFIDLLDKSLSSEFLVNIKSNIADDVAISDFDVFLCEKIRILHDTDFCLTPEFIELQDLVIKAQPKYEELLSKYKEEVSELIVNLTEEKVFELRNFICTEICDVVSKILTGVKININFKTKLIGQTNLQHSDEAEWDLNEEMLLQKEGLEEVNYIHDQDNSRALYVD